MSDAAAFFANKKKSKKKAFKFNANKIDAATVTTTVHVDAPALSTDAEVSSIGTALASTSIAENDSNQNTNNTNTKFNGGSVEDPALATGGQWDDEALAASYSRKGAVAAASTAEVLDMKAFDAKRRDQDDIAERMRLEETKAQLAAAREGMEREAQRLKEERERKREETKKPESRAIGGISGIGAGGKWVPPHMRSGSGLSRVRMGSVGPPASQKLDTQDSSLFPDLAAADKILEQQKGQESVAYKVQKKTPVGGGATWGSRPPIARQKQLPESKPKTPEPDAEIYVPPSTKSTQPPPIEKKKPTKKKKKDLSTFKPSSS